MWCQIRLHHQARSFPFPQLFLLIPLQSRSAHHHGCGRWVSWLLLPSGLPDSKFRLAQGKSRIINSPHGRLYGVRSWYTEGQDRYPVIHLYLHITYFEKTPKGISKAISTFFKFQAQVLPPVASISSSGKAKKQNREVVEAVSDADCNVVKLRLGSDEAYCTNPINSSVTRHRGSEIDEILRGHRSQGSSTKPPGQSKIGVRNQFLCR